MAASAQHLASSTTLAAFADADSLRSRHYLLEGPQGYFSTCSLSEGLAASDTKEKLPTLTVPPAPPSSPAPSQNGGRVQLPSIASLCLRGMLQKQQHAERPGKQELNSFILFSSFPSANTLRVCPSGLQSDSFRAKRSTSSLLKDTLIHSLAENAEIHGLACDGLAAALKRRQTLPNMAYRDRPASKNKPLSLTGFAFQRRAPSVTSTAISPTSHLKVNFKPLRCKSPDSLDAINGLLTLSGAKRVSNNTMTNVSVLDMLQSRSSQSPADRAFGGVNAALSSMTAASSKATHATVSCHDPAYSYASHNSSNRDCSSGRSVCHSLISEYASLAKKKRRVHMCSHQDCYKIFPSLSRLERHERVHEEKKVFLCESLACSRKFNSEDKLVSHMRKHLHV